MRLGVEAALVDGELVRGDVEIDGGIVQRVALGGAGRGTAIPPFVDLQVNGHGGIDVLHEPERVDEVGQALSRLGVLEWQPTLVSAPAERTVDALAAMRGARIAGVHLEGPFLAPEYAGAHPPDALREPDVALLRSFLDAGPVSMVTLAPELPGALDLVDECVARGVRVSLGHTGATAAEAAAAFARGAASVTHVFNAMRPFHHREPGIAGLALVHPVTVMLIADGVHLADDVVSLVFAAAGERAVVVSDAIAAAGLGDGDFPLGETVVRVRGGVCRRADGGLAGSAVALPDALPRLVASGLDVATAVRALSGAPARLIGVHDRVRLSAGHPANLVVIDDGLRVTRVLRDGVPLD